MTYMTCSLGNNNDNHNNPTLLMTLDIITVAIDFYILNICTLSSLYFKGYHCNLI